jgi:excisionase family DNA binding protein
MAGQNRTKMITEFRASDLPDPPPRLREVLDIRQAAEYLGISPDSLYKYASENFIPAFRLGNRWRFKRSLLEGWMEQQSGMAPSVVREKRAKAKQKKPSTRAR